MPGRESSGFLHDGVPYLRLGDGPPLVMVQGLTPEHDVPKGFERRMVLSSATPLSRHFTVYVVNRKRGLQPGASMSDIAGHIATAIEQDVGEPVLLQGTSTGGSVVLQLAADRPDLVQRLVVVAAAYRLGPHGRQIQAELARLTRAGEGAAGMAGLTSATLPRPLRPVLRPVLPLVVRSLKMVADDPSDMLVTLDAEDAFDLEADLPRITAPTLVIGGTADPFYTRELFEGTASGVRDGRAHVYEGWGHLRTASSSTTLGLTLGFLLAGAAASSHGLTARPDTGATRGTERG